MNALHRFCPDPSHQEEWWREAEADFWTKEAIQTSPGLVERVLQNVRKRLGWPAREAMSQSLPEVEGDSFPEHVHRGNDRTQP